MLGERKKKWIFFFWCCVWDSLDYITCFLAHYRCPAVRWKQFLSHLCMQTVSVDFERSPFQIQYHNILQTKRELMQTHAQKWNTMTEISLSIITCVCVMLFLLFLVFMDSTFVNAFYENLLNFVGCNFCRSENFSRYFCYFVTLKSYKLSYFSVVLLINL